MIKKQHIHIFSLLLGTVAVIATVILNISSPTNAASWVLDGGNVTWDNSNFIDASFWNDNPSTGDIIKALYGSGVGDTTAYTTNWSGRNTAQCSGSDMTVIETGNLPATLSANTIYVLTGEQAIVSSKINLANCSAIVSKNISGTTLYSAEYLGTSITLLNINKKKHTIIDHINVDGTNDGNGSNHTGNDYGAYYFNSSSNNTINNAQFYNNNYYGIFIWSTLYTSVSNSQLYNNNSAGIRVYSSSNNFINDSQFYDNNDGITLEGSSTNNSINDSQFYTNYGDGILINSGANNSIDNIQVYNNELNGIIISSGTNNTINNSQTYNNNQYGIRILLSSNNSINNIQAYNNEFDGIRIDSGSNNSINNSQSYNNYGGGIIIYNFSSNNTINNSQLYNNYSDGIRISSSSNNTINNSQSYNNNGNGIWFSLTTNNTINNAQCYNNYINGIYFNDSSNNIINNFQGYNNRNNGFSSSVNSTGNLYYGKVSLFANGIPGIGQASGNFSTGYANDQPVQSLGRATGELITTGTMSWDYITNPLNTVGDYLLSWSDSWTSLRSTKLSYSGTVTDKYSFGSGILLQTQPVIWSGTTDLISSGSFDPTKYIGSDVVKVTGELLGLPAMTSGLNFTVTGNSSDNLVNNYSLFGNISSSEYNIPGTSTEITFTAGDGEKRIVTQLFGAIYFATHFETTTILDTMIPNQVQLFSPYSGEVFATGNITGLFRYPLVDVGSPLQYCHRGYLNAVDIGGDCDNDTGYFISFDLPDGIYTRNVYAKDAFGNTGAVSETRGFTIDATPPSQVTLISPSSGNSLTTGDVPLVRSSAIDTGVGISGYYFEIVGTNYSGFLIQTGTTITGITDGNYQWHVYAIDTIGNTGSRSETRGFTVDSTVCSNTRNNDNFITGAFWNTNPADKCIIEALYGTTGDTNTAYTNYRSGYTSGTCLSSMSVTGVSNLPATLSANTIYVLTGEQAIVPTTRNLNNCSAVISKNISGTTFFSTGSLFSSFTTSNKRDVIIDNIILDGRNDGLGLSHDSNSYGVYILNSSNTTVVHVQSYNNGNGIGLEIAKNNTIAHTQAYRNDNVGIYLQGNSNNNTIVDNLAYSNLDGIYITMSSNGNIVDNISSYNNTNNGIKLNSSSNNTINNSQTYNNSSIGVYLQSSSNNAINNFQSYNNTKDGIKIESSSNYNLIKNTQIYNNSIRGIELLASTNNIINNVMIFNNYNYAIYLDAYATGNIYYGDLTFFANFNSGVGGTSGNLSTGYANDALVQGLGRTTGNIITTGTMSWDLITNPLNTSGNYLLPWSGDWTSIGGHKSTYSGSLTQAYSFGSGIFTQVQPVIWSGTTELINSGTFNPTQYIGSNTTKLTGSLSGTIPTRTNSTGIYTVQPLASIATGYTLFGNILGTPYNNTIGISTGIKLTTGDGQKNIITQIYGSFATHFQTTTILDQTPPSFEFPSRGGNECITSAYLTIASATPAIDTGVGLSSIPYSFDGITWTGNATINIATQQPGTQTRTGRVRDDLGNSSYKVSIFTFYDALPIASNFTGSSNVSSTSKTADWITQSIIQEGSCGNTDISYSGMVTQATKGVCNVSGNDITYTPNLNQTGTDSCTMQAKDNENNTVNIIVYRENIDTIVLYCGDGIVQTPNRSGNNEQCDLGSENGPNSACSSECTWNMPICTIEPISKTIYSGAELIITGTAISGARFTDINFGLPDELFSINQTGIYITGHTYNNGGIFVITGIVDNPLSGNMVNFCTGMVTVQYCGDGDVNGSEQCDGEIGCSNSCIRELVSCFLEVSSPIYSGQLAIITGTVNPSRTIVSGFNFGLPNYSYSIGLSGNYSTGHTYNSGGIYQVTMDVVHPGSGDITDSCTGSIEVQYCGDGDVNGTEQCDGEIGCSTSCTREAVSCSLNLPASIYSGSTTTITGTVNHTRTIVSGFNFGPPNYSYSIGLSGNYSTGHIYNSGGVFEIIMDVVHPGSGDITYSCTGSINVQYCGDSLTQSSYESCDSGANNGVACSPIYGGTCYYCSASCEEILLTGAYCGDGDVNGTEQCDGEIGCSNSCTREAVSCSLNIPTSIYSGQLATITGTVNYTRTIVSGFNFGPPNYSYSIGLSGNYSTGHIYNSGGVFEIIMDVVHPGSGDITDSCTGSIEVQYCGDGDVNGTEQCDGEIGCSTSCTREAVSCSLNLPASIYSGSTTTITGTVNHTRTIVSGFNFGPPNYSYSIGLSGNYSTGHIYNSGGVFEIIMDVVHPGSGDITASCTGSIQVQYCGDGIMNGSEDCDGGIGCSSSCTLIPPTNTDCTLPWGGTIVSGASVTAYQSVSVACGTSCVSQTRTCLSGTLSGTFTQQTCGVQTCGGTTTIIGGGGSTIIPRDDCTLPSNVACANAEGLDNSPSYYDNSCCGTSVSTGGTHGAASTCDVSDSPYSSEITDAFSWAYGINITDKCPITTARLDSKITRIEAAKMMSMFTIQIIGLTPNTSKKGCDKFSDLGSVSDDMKFFAKTACQLDIMGLEPDGKTPKKKFDPKDLIDRAQFGTMLSRLVYGDVYNLSSREKKTIARYQKHLEALGKDNIIQKAPNPWIQENRSRVMIMLKRTQDQGLVEKYHLVAPAHNGASALFDNVW